MAYRKNVLIVFLVVFPFFHQKTTAQINAIRKQIKIISDSLECQYNNIYYIEDKNKDGEIEKKEIIRHFRKHFRHFGRVKYLSEFYFVASKKECAEIDLLTAHIQWMTSGAKAIVGKIHQIHPQGYVAGSKEAAKINRTTGYTEWITQNLSSRINNAQYVISENKDNVLEIHYPRSAWHANRLTLNIEGEKLTK